MMTDTFFSHTALKIAGVVVLYNPNETLIQNIDSYISNIDTLFVIDNSDTKTPSIIDKMLHNPKIHYIDNHGNQGIANALNIGANEAIKMGYEWLLTMDQDSKVLPSMLINMLQCYQKHSSENIGMLSPYHANRFFPISKNPNPCNEVLVAMTSGNLLNLNAFMSVGPFWESLFIDHVDTEYCLRLWDRGYKILQVNHAILDHKVGDLKLHKIGKKTFFSTNHSPIRKYYVYRNGSFVLDLYKKKFPEYCKKLRARYWIDAFIVLFYETKKIAKFKMMFRGYLDYKRSVFGKYRA